MARTITHGVNSSTLADILERVLDKGIVIAGDIKINLVDIELLTIKIRLVICSVEKAKEIGIDWWVTDKNLSGKANKLEINNKEKLNELNQKIDKLENIIKTTKFDKIVSQ